VLLGELLDGAGNRISGKVCTAPARSVTWPGLGPAMRGPQRGSRAGVQVRFPV